MFKEMFQDSLISSRTTGSSRRTRWIALTSVTLQAVLVAAIVLVPLLWPDTLTNFTPTPKPTVITMRKPPAKLPPVKLQLVMLKNASSFHAPSAPAPSPPADRPRLGDAHNPMPISGDAPPSVTFGPIMGPMSGPANGVPWGSTSGSGTGGPIVTAIPRSTGPVRVSDGVSKGMLIAPIQPVYPRIAISTRTEGTVVVAAVIDKLGHISGLHILSGPPLLRQAAVDAIRDARYHPYLLNGQPTEVETTISVIFHMSS